jgi:hypothetical protein
MQTRQGFAFMLTLPDATYCTPYIERADGASWEDRGKPAAPVGCSYRGGCIESAAVTVARLTAKHRWERAPYLGTVWLGSAGD